MQNSNPITDLVKFFFFILQKISHKIAKKKEIWNFSINCKHNIREILSFKILSQLTRMKSMLKFKIEILMTNLNLKQEPVFKMRKNNVKQQKINTFTRQNIFYSFFYYNFIFHFVFF